MTGMPFNDSQLWIAMACYESEQLHVLKEVTKCYKMAANCNDRN